MLRRHSKACMPNNINWPIVQPVGASACPYVSKSPRKRQGFSNYNVLVGTCRPSVYMIADTADAAVSADTSSTYQELPLVAAWKSQKRSQSLQSWLALLDRS